jgi:hypothetical protein
MTARLSVVALTVALSAGAAEAQTAPPACEPAPGQAAAVGRVTDRQTGLPLQEADIRVQWDEGTGTLRRREVETDAAGYFAVCDLPAGTRVRVLAEFGRANERVFVDLEAGRTHAADIELDAPRSRVSGRVVQAGTSRGIADVELSIPDSRVRAVSAADGTFMLPDVPPGDYVLTTSHVAYATRSDSIKVQYGTIVRYTIGLAESVIAMPEIMVDVRSHVLEIRGFYDRQERGFGAYLTRFSWEQRMPRIPSDILRGVAGVRVVPGNRGFGSVVLDRSNCAFRYVVDGARVSGDFQIDDMPVEWIEALEVYRGVSQVPGEFTAPPSAARANCGVIVIWTRGAR